MTRVSRALTCIVFLIVVVLCWARPVHAEDARRGGTIRLETTQGRRGPMELRPTKDGLAADIVITNDGKEPLVVSRIAIHGDVSEPRVPAKLVARLSEGALPATIGPGASRHALVQWVPERGGRMRQLFGHVVVTSSDEQSGEVAMGVHAQLPGGLGGLDSHLLSLLIGLPLVGAVGTLLLRAFGQKDERVARMVALVALALHTLIAFYIYHEFAPDVSRADGNDGLQFIEHAVWMRPLGAALYFGVDGIAASTLVGTALVAFFGLVSERADARTTGGYHAAYLVLVASVSGALTAMDGLLFVLFMGLSFLSATLLVGAWGGEGRRLAATRLSLHGLFAVILVLIAVLAVARQSDPVFMVDGTRAPFTYSFPELSRVALGAKGASLLGGALVKVAFVLVLVASLTMLGAFPLHGWLAPVLSEAPAASGALLGAAFPTLGTCLLLRLGCLVLPEGMRWASGVVVALGAVTAAYGALGALGQGDLRRLAARATTCQVGFVLLGAGALTPQGICGAMMLVSVRTITAGLFLLLAEAVDERGHTRDVGHLSGITAQMPIWSALLAAASLGQAGVIGFAGAWGPTLAIAGALPNYAPLALVAALALLVLAAAHLHAVSRLVFGRLSPDWETHGALAPFGGKFPDLVAREWLSVAPLAVLVIVLGLWPAPLLASTAGTARDLTNAVSPKGPDQVT